MLRWWPNVPNKHKLFNAGTEVKINCSPLFRPHSVGALVCFVWHSEHTAIVSLYSVKVLQSQGGKEYPTYNKEQSSRTGHTIRRPWELPS
jgi:hypothetical protein